MREMKDSGIEWIGNIPATWERCKIKNVISSIGSGTTPTSSNIDYYNSEDIRWIQSGDLYKTSYISNTAVSLSAKALHLSALQIYAAPFIVVAMYGASVGNIAISTIDACSNQACCCIKPDNNNDLKFMYYWLSMCKIDFLSQSIGGGQPNISQSKIKNQFYYRPQLSEQKVIANFLDSKCSEIDAISADIQKEIETLEQYKRSVITEAVTKGLNPDAEMKDSSVEWVGIIPASWTSSRLGYETYIRARLGWKGLKADEYVDEGYAFISAFNIQNNKLVWMPLNYITKERYDESPEIKLHIGDVIIVKDGAGIGKCARIDSLPMGETAPNSSIGVITPLAKLNYRYLAYYLQSAIFNNLILKLLNGMGVPHLTQEVLNKTPILLPPKQEQVRIANFLDSKCCEIDSAIETKKKQIDILDAYKKSLIYEYVTGKKEVPVQN